MSLTLPHDAHAGWESGHAVAFCRDCEWRKEFPVINYPDALTAWHEAAYARDTHHDTHRKEFA